MKEPDARHRRLSVVAALVGVSCVLSACSTGGGSDDSTRTDAAARGDSIGDLTGAPRAADSARTPAATPVAPSTSKSVASPKPGSSTKPAPTAKPALDTGAQRRNDGSMMNPPIHRTNPRDDDIMEPVAPGAGTGQPAIDLLAEIRALAKPGGCASSSDCQTLPVGRKACGGPRTYVVFCPKSTDVAALRAKIAELDRVDQATAKNTVSDCMMVMPPRMTASGGVCRASNDP